MMMKFSLSNLVYRFKPFQDFLSRAHTFVVDLEKWTSLRLERPP